MVINSYVKKPGSVFNELIHNYESNEKVCFYKKKTAQKVILERFFFGAGGGT